MKTLTLEEVRSQRSDAQREVDKLQSQKTVDLEEGKISIARFNEISATQGRIQNKINELNVLLVERVIDSITVEDNSPGAKLRASINQLSEAIDRLNDIRNFLEAAASVINGLNVLIGILAALPII